MKSIIGRITKIKFDGGESFAKSDTGAYTSSINAEIVDDINGLLTIKLLPHERWNLGEKTITTDDYTYKNVKSSTGINMRRAVIKLSVIHENKEYLMEFTVNNREKMNFPILLGRKTLKNFLVDVEKTVRLSKF